MIRVVAVLLLFVVLFAVPAAAGVTEFDAEYVPEGPVVAGQEISLTKNIFVGERFSSSYTLEFTTDLNDCVWRIDLVVQNRTTQSWEFPYSQATVSGFTISTAERDTWLVTTLTGTPSVYDEGKEITLWKMRVMMTENAAKDTFVSVPVRVQSPPVPTAGPLPVTTLTPAATTVPQTPTTVPATTVVTATVTTMATTVPTTQPATPASSFCCGAGLAAVLGLALIRRR